MRRKSARSSRASFPTPRPLLHRGFRPAVLHLEDRTLLSLNPTFTSVVASVGQAVYGSPVTFTATVSEFPYAGATPTGGTVAFYDGSTEVGTASLIDGSATLTTSALPVGLQTNSAVYSGDGQTFAGSSSGTIATIASGLALGGSSGVAVDDSGDLFIADSGNNVVREVTPEGAITIVAGNGTAGYSGDGQAATAAELNDPTAVAVDGEGDLFIADYGNNVVREVKAGSGIITTVAVNWADYGTNWSFSDITGVASDAAGDLWVASTLVTRSWSKITLPSRYILRRMPSWHNRQLLPGSERSIKCCLQSSMRRRDDAGPHVRLSRWGMVASRSWPLRPDCRDRLSGAGSRRSRPAISVGMIPTRRTFGFVTPEAAVIRSRRLIRACLPI